MQLDLRGLKDLEGFCLCVYKRRAGIGMPAHFAEANQVIYNKQGVTFQY